MQLFPYRNWLCRISWWVQTVAIRSLYISCVRPNLKVLECFLSFIQLKITKIRLMCLCSICLLDYHSFVMFLKSTGSYFDQLKQIAFFLVKLSGGKRLTADKGFIETSLIESDNWIWKEEQPWFGCCQGIWGWLTAAGEENNELRWSICIGCCFKQRF